jgi:hypothetical protein
MARMEHKLFSNTYVIIELVIVSFFGTETAFVWTYVMARIEYRLFSNTYIIIELVTVSFLEWKLHLFGHTPGCVGVCRHMHAFSLAHHATRRRCTVSSFVAPLAPPHFSTLSHKLRDFRK